MPDLVDRYFAAQDALFEHCGYQQDWRLFPVDDERESYWRVGKGDRGECRWSAERKAVELWDDESDYPEEYGDVCYSGAVYTYRHQSKWVYRGSIYTMVLVDTRADLNINLLVFRSDHEVK